MADCKDSGGPTVDPKDAKAHRDRLMKVVWAVACANEVVEALEMKAKCMAATNPTGQASTIQSAAGNSSKVHNEFLRGVKAIVDASSNERLTVSRRTLRTICNTSGLAGCLEWFFIEAEDLIAKADDEDGMVLWSVFGIQPEQAE